MGDQENFADKVIQSLKGTRAVDLTEDTTQPDVEAASADANDLEFRAFGQPGGGAGGTGPATGGNKDIVILPGFGGAASTSPSQINFYWNAPTTPDLTGIGNSIRTTIYNFAASATQPQLVIGGYDGTVNYVPTPTYGSPGGVGSTAKIFIDPFLGSVSADYHIFNSAGTAATAITTAGFMYYDPAQGKFRGGTGAATAKTFAFTDDVTAASGLATTANNVSAVTATTSSDHFILFSPQNGLVAGIAVSTDATLKYNPATDLLTVSNVSGTATTGQNVNVVAATTSANHPIMFTPATSSVSGAATSTVSTVSVNPNTGTITATTFSGALTGNASGYAQTSRNVDLVFTTAAGNHYITFSPQGSSVSGSATSAVTTVYVTPSTGTINATTFSGAFSGNLTGNVTGFATTGQNVNVVAATTSASHPVMFTPATASVSGAATSTVSTVSVNPSTGTLTAAAFSGPLTGNVTGTATTATNVNVATTNTASTVYPVFSGAATTVTGTGLSSNGSLSYVPSTGTLTATTFSGNVTGTVTGNVTGFAQTARNIDLVFTTASGNHYITFSPQGTSVSGAATSSVTTVFVTPSTGTLTATTFSGTLSGNAGSATTARNIDVATTNTGSTVYPVFTGAATTTVGTGLSSNGSLSYVPSTGTLSATTFSGAFTGNVSGFAQTGRNVNVVAATTSSAHPIMFTPTSGSLSGAATSTVSTVTVNPSNGTVAATTFSGTLSGYASTSNNVNVVSTNENLAHYFVFTPASGTVSGAAVSTDSTVTINPSTNAMSLGTGNLTANGVVVGSASNTINTSSGNLTIDSSGGTVNLNDNLVVSGNLTVNGTTTTIDSTVATLVDPVIVLGAGLGGTTPSSDDNKDRGIEFRWFSGTAQTGFFGFDDSSSKFTFIPNAINLGEVFSGTAGTALFGEVEATLKGNAAGSAATYTNFYGSLAGNVTGTATTGQNVNVVTTTANAFHSLLFSPATTSVSGAAVSSGAGLTYNPSTQTLYATNIVGTVTGTISGIAQTANNLTLVSTTASGNHYLTFSPASGNVAGAAVSTVTSVYVTPSTGTVTATAFSGPLTGNVTGNVTGFAQTSRNIDLVFTTASGNHYLTFSPQGASVSGAATSAVTTVYVTPSTGTVTATTFSGAHTGNLTGFATTGQNVNVVAATTNTNHPVMFTPATTSVTGAATSTVSTVSVNPSTGTLTAAAFSGPLTGNVTGTATTATNVNVATTNTASTVYPVFSGAATTVTGTGLSSSGSLSYVPSTGTLTATTFSGNVTGTVTGNVTGFAQTARNVDLVFTTASGNHYITFSPQGTSVSGSATSAVTTVFVTPSTGTVTATTFSGNVTGTVTGNVTGFAQTSRNIDVVAATTNLAHPITFTPATGSVSGAATSSVSTVTVNPSNGTVAATTFSGAFTGNLTGFATTGQNVNIVAATTSASHPILFTPATTSVTGGATSTVSTVSVNPNTGTVTATTFSGAFSGNVSGYAQTSRNVDVVSTTASGNHYLTFSPASSSVSGAAVSTNSALYYVPSTGTLNLSNVSGTGVTVTASSALTNGTYFTIKTVAGDDNNNVDFFIRGTSSDNTSRFSIDTAGNLRATTKSFDIEHPTKPGKRLVYGVLEGPEHGVYHRGTVEGKGNITIELPEYWDKLVNEDYSIQLTSWGNYNVHIVEKTSKNFIIALTGNPLSQKFKVIKVDYVVHGSRKDAPLEIEQ